VTLPETLTNTVSTSATNASEPAPDSTATETPDQ
jgi:hypothetical protein